MNLGVQYYRAPFPESKYWENDFKAIKEAGLDTVQLWVLWAWVESKPDNFNYDDYDRLIEIADRNNLKVVLSTIAEIQPHWIHRVVPDSEMIDHLGHKVISSLRCECNFGLTPGGCTDNPQVWERMAQFIRKTGERYAKLDHLHGWDIWNELRWNVQADNLVCFCPHTLKEFHLWLDQQYSGLEGLNAAWKRRYICWEDVAPGKLPDRPYTEMMAWQHFITERANRHAARRYAVMKAIDQVHPVTAHGACPSADYRGWTKDYPIDRGNDWVLAETLDGIGCSSFPQWSGIDDAEFGSRVEMVKSAANGKKVWLSEVQGGRAAVGFNIYGKVEAAPQQRWIWNGLACGADTILFWCWRDEVFGRESAGFGLSGRDGLAPRRLEAMRFTGKLLAEKAEIFNHYTPDSAEIGILFTPQNYYLAWAQEGDGKRMGDAINGYARSLVRQSIPYCFLEEQHLNYLQHLKLIILPRSIVLNDYQTERLSVFVQNGGTLLVESECGAFGSEGFYRYPEDRFLARFGIVEAGRRNLETDSITLKLDEELSLDIEQWITPLEDSANVPAQVFSTFNGQALAAEFKVGQGRIVYLGSYFGNPYLEKRNPDFESFIQKISTLAGVEPAIEVVSPLPTRDEFIYVKSGHSKGKLVTYLFFPGDDCTAKLKFSPELLPGNTKLTELMSNQTIALINGIATIKPARFKMAILSEE
jgi:beta-galactosidase